MKIIITIEEADKLDLSLDEALYLVAIYVGKSITSTTFNNLCNKGLLEYSDLSPNREPINLCLTSTGVEKVETLLLNSEVIDTPTTNYAELAADMREIFPKGSKVIDGRSYPWRDSISIIEKRLKALVKKYNVVLDKEKVLKATKLYVESFNNDFTRMRLLKYFIFKNDTKNGELEESSELLSRIENLEDLDLEATNSSLSEDFTIHLV